MPSQTSSPITYEQHAQPGPDRAALPFAILVLIGAVALIWTSRYSYLLFHSLAEMFSIVVAFSVFVVTWNARRFLKNGYLLFLGIALLFIAGVDLLHTLAFRGMGVFTTFTESNLATQLWLVGRYLQALTFVLAPLWLTRPLRAVHAILGWGVITALLLASIFWWRIFPVAYLDPTGLTPFKIVSEYIIILLYGLAAYLLWRRRAAFEGSVFRWLIISVIASIFTELAFTNYVQIYSIINLSGHLLKIVAFYAVYKAIVETGFIKPYDLLFRDLTQSRETIRQSNEILEQRVQARTQELQHLKDNLEILVRARTTELRQEIELRQQVERELRENQERLTIATESAAIGAWDWNLCSDELLWTERAKAAFGLPADATVSYDRFLAIVAPNDRDYVQAVVAAAVATGQDYLAEFRVIWPDSSVHWIYARGRVLFDQAEQPQRMLGIVMDSTPRKQAEIHIAQTAARAEALAEISKLLASLPADESSADSQTVFDHSAQILGQTLGDLCFIRLLDPDQTLRVVAVYHADPQIAASARALLTAAPQSIHEAASGAALTANQPLLVPVVSSHDLETRTKSAYLDWIRQYGMASVMIAPITAQNEMIGVINLVRHQPGNPYTAEDFALGREVAERAALAILNARLLRQIQRELTLRTHADRILKQYAQQLSRSNRELQDFASIASHDLQEPLRKVRAFGDRLKERYAPALGDDGRDYLERMQNAAERMQSMLDALLAYSRVTTKMQPPAPVNLAEIAREVLLDLEIRVEDTQGQVILGSLPTLDADPLQMRQLFQNLIGNALKFHRPDQPPVVRVDAQVETNGDGAEQVRLTFADNGIGFDERYLERIFQPFYRLHGRAEYEGTGMGLAICRKIVERHNGSITAASQIDSGTIFTILLPRHPQPEGSIQPPTLA